MPSRICARCGRETNATIRGLCSRCFVEVYGVAKLPTQVNLVVCKYCGSIKVKGEWVSPTEASIEDSITDILFTILTGKMRASEGIDYAWIESISLPNGVPGPGIHPVIAKVMGSIRRDIEVSEDKILRLKLDIGVCPSCTNKITKRGYDAIIQVRSSSGRLAETHAEMLDDILSSLDPGLKSSIISIEEGKNGVDILVDEVSSARVIASKIRSQMLGKMQEAYKLVGRRSDGKRKGRLTISIRIPDIAPGDIIEVGSRKYLIIALNRGGVIAYNMDTGAEETLGVDDLWRQGFTKNESIPASTLMLLYHGRDTLLFAEPNSPGEVIEYPASSVRTLTDGLEEGREYRVIRYGKLIYVVGGKR